VGRLIHPALIKMDQVLCEGRWQVALKYHAELFTSGNSLERDQPGITIANRTPVSSTIILSDSEPT
jgi:hypothetical protein